MRQKRAEDSKAGGACKFEPQLMKSGDINTTPPHIYSSDKITVLLSNTTNTKNLAQATTTIFGFDKQVLIMIRALTKRPSPDNHKEPPMSNTEVQCLCGTAKLKLTGEPIAQVYCHCADCQIAHSAAYVATVAYPTESVAVLSGAPAALIVKTASRMRCPSCGTFLFTEVAAAGLRSVNANLLPKGQFKPQLHIHCQDAVLPVVDNLPHYKTLPAAFGGSDEVIGW